MTSLIETAISRTRTTMSLLVIMVLIGVMARLALPIANDPHVDLPLFYVGVVHEGISPEDAERLLVQPLEIELRKLEGIVELKSTAAEGMASAFIEFDVSQDLSKALSDVREAVDAARAEMPATAEEPFVEELTADSFPMLQINFISETASERQLYQAALALREEIESVPAVLSADLQGHREEVLEVVIDPDALNAYRLSAEELLVILQRNNRLIPAGTIELENGRFAVKVPAIMEQAEDVLALPLRSSAGSVVTLKDVATVRRTFKDRSSFARYNGSETISISVKKRANANVIDSVEEVLEIVEAARTGIPSGIEMIVSQNQAEFAAVQVRELEGNILTALALVMVLVVATMGFRSGLIVGLGIPFSLLFSVTIIYLLGYTFNFMVMFGMLLGLGMLIDGGIVVTEYANRMMSEGMDHKSAYAESVKRMFWPVTASTATTLAAFLPMLFWPGVSGQFMGYLPVTVFTVLIGSLLYALLFGPVLGTLFGKPSMHNNEVVHAQQVLESGDPTQLKTFTGRFARFLSLVCGRPILAVGIVASVLVSIFWAYGKFGVGTIFFSDADPQFIQVSVLARGNFSASEVNDLVLDVEKEILEIPGIRFINTQTSLPGLSNDFMGSSSDRIASLFLELYAESQRDLGGNAIIREIRQRTDRLAGIHVEVQPLEKGPPIGKPIQIEFTSQDRPLLEPAMTRVRAYLDSLPELVDIDDSAALPSIEWRVEVDRKQAALFGADVSSAGLAVQLVTNGVKVGEYRPDDADDAVDIRVRYPSSERGIRAMEELRVSTAQGMIPLSNFVKIQPAPGVDAFKRIDGLPVELIRASVRDGVMADGMVAKIDNWLQQQDFDPALNIRFRGANEEQADSMAFVSAAFLLALALMFILLVTQFNNFYQSALILLAVIMSTAGVLLGLLLLSNPFSALLTGVGVVALAGIVVNNNIILIDTFNHVRAQHPELDTRAVIVRAAAQRLRPVLLTTVTTVFGLLPLACGYSIDLTSRTITAEGEMAMFWAPLSQAIVFGLSFATLLTLIVTPAMLALPESLQALPSRLGIKRSAPTPHLASD
ncbi:efflux RND transporter permease subunit [Halieaceae bacterium IMCC14734]|uniref:Efflux RND transporter permease subunit n=1 Tax=Candidatus Litorirhabdus singularis TaxID=2518993 RepID=A0ABT3TFT9_9GAMM|nr:efflux RND transporter permease subunit [Candidatus Litorirhabdus singularis]MCX2980690.1 efflux RND transporter permease subunit [Candidatus Litorirhabdus singularis]